MTKSTYYFPLGFVASLIFTVNCAFAAGNNISSAEAMASLSDEAKRKVSRAALISLLEGEEQEFIVLFKDERPAEERGKRKVKRNDNVSARLKKLDKNKRDYARTKALAIQHLISAGDAVILTEYDALRSSHVLTGNRSSFIKLLENERVEAVFENEVYETQTTESLPLIRQPEVAHQGLQGAGATVVVADTGVDYFESFFNCTGVGTPAACKVSQIAEFAPDDGILDDSGHGTHVSAIVSSVAPEAKLAVADVFDGVSSNAGYITLAINWAINNQAAWNVVAINLSLGSSDPNSAGSNCDTALASSIADALDVGIVTMIASGNSAWKDKIASPACVKHAVSVGSVYDGNVGGIGGSSCTDSATYADLVSCFSNSSDYLDALAPGAMISAAGLLSAGTSQAAPHVAGAVAVLRAAGLDDEPNNTARRIAEQTIQRLLYSGEIIKDPANGLYTPRLDLAAAVSSHWESTIQGMYVAYYGRPGDPGGVDYWAQRLVDAGGNLSEVLPAFGDSSEFVERFGHLTNSELINNLYLQIFGRPAEPGGLDYWAGRLSSGESTLVNIAKQIFDGAGGNDILRRDNRIQAASFVTGFLRTEGLPYTAIHLDPLVNAALSIDETEESTIAAKKTMIDVFTN